MAASSTDPGLAPIMPAFLPSMGQIQNTSPGGKRMTSTIQAPRHVPAADRGEADQALKARHRTMWALGDYSAVASEIIAGFGPILVEAAGIEAGQLVLDVAAGSGNISIPAALRGARVTASDLTPDLLEIGRAEAEAAGLDIAWEVGDAEALPYADAQFDVVTSC